jgi:argininosuccinate lyase
MPETGAGCTRFLVRVAGLRLGLLIVMASTPFCYKDDLNKKKEENYRAKVY